MSVSPQKLADWNGQEVALSDELRAALARYRHCEPLEEGFLVLDALWRIVYLNPAAARTLGRTRPDLMGAVLWVGIPELGESLLETELRAAVEATEARTFRVYLPPALCWLQARAEPTDEGLYLYLRGVPGDGPVADAVDNFEESFVLLDREGNYLYVNRQAARMAECAPEDLIGKNGWELYPRTRNSPIYEAFHRALDTGEVVQVEIVSPTLNRHLAMSFYPQGEQVAILARDITERKRAEDALRESETRLRAFYDTSPLFMGVTELGDDDVLHLYDNPATCRFFGAEPGATVGKWALAELGAAPATVTLWREAYRASEKKGEPVHFDQEYPSADGSQWLSVTVCSIGKGASGRSRFCYVAEDITDRKRSEDALRESEERLRLATQTSGLGFYDVDVARNGIYWSLELRQIQGVAEDTEITWDYAGGLIHTDDIGRVREKWQAALDPNGTGEFRDELRIVRADTGEARWTDNHGRVFFEGSGAERRAVRVVGVVADITAQKRAQQDIADLNVRLQRAVAETHHRVKNNLQTLSALMEIQLPDTEESTIPASAFRRIWQHTRTLAALHDLLTQESKVAADQGAVSLKAALEKLVPLLQATAGPRKIRARAEEVRLSIKQGGSFVLLVNELVSNALKHGRGDVEVTLSVSSPQDVNEPQMARLEVCDDGPGFPPDFDPLEAANVGLELVQSLAEWDLRGRTGFTNRSEGGGRVLVTFATPPT